MKTIQMELFTDEVNSPTVRIPGRKHPGVVIQGDSLWVLYSTAKELLQYCTESDLEEPKDLASELTSLLRGYLLDYESALKMHGVALPYRGSVSSEHFVDKTE